MQKRTISPETAQELLKAQRNEITEFHIYTNLAKSIKDRNNSDILRKIGEDEGRHADFWSSYTGVRARPYRFRIFAFYWIARILGITFGIKLMERREAKARIDYGRILAAVPEGQSIYDEEEEHEDALIGMLEEEGLSYMGSVVLGLNDALVELTGALAGLTLALQDTNLIAVAGLVTGIAASMSMAASEYLSQKSEGQGRTAVKSAVYTGIAYIFTVAVLILPFLLIPNVFLALAVTLAVAVFVIAGFNYYISVAQDLSFAKRFWEMAILSFSVAALSFGIGFLIRTIFGVDV